MTRGEFIERALRQIYNGYVSDDSEVTPGLVNSWLQDAIGVAAKANYTDTLKIDGIGYVNNSFYTTYRGLDITKDSANVYSIALPHPPFGIGRNEGISVIQVKNDKETLSFPLIPISANQRTYFQNMPVIPNKIIYYYEGDTVEIYTNIPIKDYTANITMISGGDSTDLTGTLNVPADYFPPMVEYIKQQILVLRNVPKDVANDGRDLAG